MTSPLPKPSEAAALCAKSYSDTPRWDVKIGDVKACDYRIGDYRIIAIPGTTRNGWTILRDLRFLPWLFIVGLCAAGFGKGVQVLIEETSFLVPALSRKSATPPSRGGNGLSATGSPR
jgi:hypothetical protein